MANRPYITEEVNDFIGQIGQESDRGKVLVSTGYIESRLQEVLLAFMVESKVSISLFSGPNSAFGNFSSRIAGCYALGLITDDEYHDLQLIRRIRNDFAHSVLTSFKTAEVVSRCKLLRSTTERVSQYPAMPAQRFESAVVAIIVQLVNRPYYVSEGRLKVREWSR
jgi:hypothetical protein